MKSIDSSRVTGIAFLVTAVLFAVPAFRYGLGSLGRFGAGVFPLVTAGLLALVGLALVVRSGTGAADAPVPAFDLRAVAAVVAGMLFGAWCMRRFGLVIAVPGAVILASFASRELRWRGTLASAAVLTLFAWLVFVAGLGIRLPLLAGF